MAQSSSAEVITFPSEADEPRREPVPLDVLPPVTSPRHGWATLASLAIVTGLAAVGLAAGVVVSELRSDQPTAETPPVDAVAVLADNQAERYPLKGSVGRIVLVVAEDGQAVLALDGLGPAPAGRSYAAWVVPPGSATPRSAGTFDASERVVALERAILSGARVAVTLEEAGASRPSRPLRLSAVRE